VSELHPESKAMTTQARFTSCSEVPPSGRPGSTHPGRLKTVRRCSYVVLLRRTINSWLSVPKILTLFISEILSHPVNAGRLKLSLCPRLVSRAGAGRTMLGMLRRHEVEILLKAGALQGRSGPSGGSFPVLC